MHKDILIGDYSFGFKLSSTSPFLLTQYNQHLLLLINFSRAFQKNFSLSQKYSRSQCHPVGTTFISLPFTQMWLQFDKWNGSKNYVYWFQAWYLILLDFHCMILNHLLFEETGRAIKGYLGYKCPTSRGVLLTFLVN